MKKVFNILFVLIVMSAVLQSCGSGYDDRRDWVIGFSQCADDEWRIKMNEDLLRESLLYDNISVDIRMAHGDNRQQIEDIKSFIEEKVDLLVVSPNEAVAITPIVEEAYNSGIPVVVVDRKVLTDCYTAFIAADNYQIGQAVGHYICSLLPNGGRIVEITGLMGSTPAMERHQGFLNVVKSHPEIDVVATMDSEWKRETAYENMLSVLSDYNRIDIVFAHNDIMAYGAYCAAMSKGRESEMKFIGVDALPGETNGVGLVLQGIMNATFIYPSGVEAILKIALDILEGRQFNRETTLSTAIVNKTNVKVMEMQGLYISEQEKKIEKLSNRIGDFSISYRRQRNLLYIALFMLLVVILGLIVIVYLLRNKSRQNEMLTTINAEISRKKMQLEEQQKQLVELSEQVKDTTQAKLVFFTNVSHDIKTPLSLIIGPLEQLMKNDSLTEEQRKEFISLAAKNADVLKKLVDQLLLFRKLEQGKTPFEPHPVDILKCLNEWNESFVFMLHQKSIAFSFVCEVNDAQYVNADQEKLERVYYNILSNAYKFTPENGRIVVTFKLLRDDDNQEFVRINVFNSGSYISSSEIECVFERFYQGNKSASQAGVGIGLALTKAFVEMHGGKISVESDENTGTSFIVDLPKVKNVHNIPGMDNIMDMPDWDDDSKEMLLLVDDNEDLLAYLRSLLSAKYNLILALDGKDGLSKAMQFMPDLIITDVMMPQMDGSEMVRLLKNSVSTCHIPVIMLTAKSVEQGGKEGYESGADSYLTKPFNSDVLFARIENLINRRKVLKNGVHGVAQFRSKAISDKEKGFIKKLEDFIDANISDGELRIDEICLEMGLSRTQLYRKVKALTDMAPNEYVRVYRLEAAKELLCTTSKSITEVGYAVGFSSPSYFIKCFREYFNETPNNFIKKQN